MIGFKQILIILGAILLIRLIGKVMNARQNIKNQNNHNNNQSTNKYQKEESKRNFGRTTIHKIDKTKIKDSDYTDFEEID